MRGSDILNVAAPHVGDTYVFGARAILTNPDHSGPWDCAEYASWCTYQAYRIVFGTYGTNPRTADAYSGKWYDDAAANGTLVSVGEALRTPGAFVVRKPGAFNTRVGHVAICVGDGTSLYEARNTNSGVVLSNDAASRNWSAGIHIPGVLYEPGTAQPYAPPQGVLEVKHPFMRGDDVLAVQCALTRLGFSVGTIDGIYGGDTANGVTNFQIARGLQVDGEVGPQTAGALDIGWPIDTSLAGALCAGYLDTDPGPDPEVDEEDQDTENDDLRGLPDDEVEDSPPTDVAAIEIEREGSRDFWAKVGEERFFVGRRVSYRSHIGLYQRIGDLPKLGGGMYDPTEAEATIGPWAHLLYPTIQGESHGYYGRLNTYDRARFTFGCFQMAAHTAGDNLILLFRKLIASPESSRYFPDLTLKRGRLHRWVDGRAVSLEREERNPNNGEMQLPDFMAYLNPTLSDVEEAEALAAARLMLWTTESAFARNAQVTLARETIKKKIRYAKAQGLDIYGLEVPLAIWAMDLRHQGRARVSQIKTALGKPNSYEALKVAGLSHRHTERVATVDAGVRALMSQKPDWAGAKLRDIATP